jgi:hypothetical protein
MGCDSCPHCEFLLRAGHGRHPNGRSPGASEHCRAGARGGACRVDVIDQQDVLSRHGCRPGHKKSAAKIHATLMWRQSRLAFGGSPSFQESGHKTQMESGKIPPENCDHGGGQSFRLVKSPLPAFPAEERNRDHEEVAGQIRNGKQLGSKQRAQRFRQRLDAIVFQQMQQAPQCATVGAVRDGFLEIRWLNAARAAQRLAGLLRVERQRFATAGAQGIRLDGKIVPAGGADRKKAKTGKMGTADAAIGREEYGTKTVQDSRQGTSEHANHRAP